MLRQIYQIKELAEKERFTVMIDGICASGKTNFIQALAKSAETKRRGVLLTEQPVTKWATELAKSYSCRTKWSGLLQQRISNTLGVLHRKKYDHVRVMDTNLFATIPFTAALGRHGKLTGIDYRAAQNSQQELLEDDATDTNTELCLILNVDVETAQRRIHQRRRRGETLRNGLTGTFLQELQEAQEEFYTTEKEHTCVKTSSQLQPLKIFSIDATQGFLDQLIEINEGLERLTQELKKHPGECLKCVQETIIKEDPGEETEVLDEERRFGTKPTTDGGRARGSCTTDEWEYDGDTFWVQGSNGVWPIYFKEETGVWKEDGKLKLAAKTAKSMGVLGTTLMLKPGAWDEFCGTEVEICINVEEGYLHQNSTKIPMWTRDGQIEYVNPKECFLGESSCTKVEV